MSGLGGVSERQFHEPLNRLRFIPPVMSHPASSRHFMRLTCAPTDCAAGVLWWDPLAGWACAARTAVRRAG